MTMPRWCQTACRTTASISLASPARQCGRMGTLALLAAVTLAAPLALNQTAQAQSPIGGFTGQITRADSEQPLLLQADELIYDNQNNRVIARNNVVIYYADYRLTCDELIYDRTQNRLVALGNVKIVDPSGTVIEAEDITLTDDFRDGFIRSLRLVAQDDTRISAESARRIDGSTTVFERGSFTPCKPCANNPDKVLWRIKARRVIQKKDEGNVYYEDATLEFFGVPVAYIPYFYHPDPSVKRRSGFLLPKFGNSDDLGFFVETPYYFALSPHYDLTVTPRFMTKQGVLMQGEWRQRTRNGAYNIKLAGIDQADAPVGTDQQRGSIETNGRFDINQYWSWGWDITALSDDTFLRYYRLSSYTDTELTNDIFLIGESDRNWFQANLYQFQALTEEDTSEAESIVHPSIDYDYIFADDLFGGELSMTGNVMSLSRTDGTDSNRLIAELSWRRTFTDQLGQVITPFFQARGDLYVVDHVVDPSTGAVSGSETITRGVPLAGIEYRFPFVKRTASAAHVIEPIAQVITRPNQGSDDDIPTEEALGPVSNKTLQNGIPNEDALSLVYDDTLLFDINKFSGFDRVETGTRANVGVRYTLQFDSGGYARVTAGQSYQLGGQNSFFTDSGLDTSSSDYVAGFYLEPVSNVGLAARTRFDEETFDIERLEIDGWGQFGPLYANVNYGDFEAQPGLGVLTDREEINGYLKLAITENWDVFASARYDLFLDTDVTNRIGVTYHDECFMLSVSYAQSFIRDRDIEPTESVTVNFVLKHLGGTSFSSDVVDIDTPGVVE